MVQGGQLNITENCLDRHLAKLGDKPAIIWEPNDPGEDHRVLTYNQLHEKVCEFANVLKEQRSQKRRPICIYMPMVPELAIAVLACARIGAIHSVVFGGFSAQSIADRIKDATCNFVITADGGLPRDQRNTVEKRDRRCAGTMPFGKKSDCTYPQPHADLYDKRPRCMVGR